MTRHEIKPNHPANSHPTTATIKEIEDALRDRPLFNNLLRMQFDGVCRRCREQNAKRRYVDVEETREHLHDGEHVHFFAYFVGEDEIDTRAAPPGYWRITEVICAGHPVLPLGDVAAYGTHQVRGHANIDKAGHEHRLVNVTIESRSPAVDGREKSVVEQRQEQLKADGSGHHPEGVIVLPRDKPEPGWPAETREWFAELLEEHGPLESPSWPSGGGEA